MLHNTYMLKSKTGTIRAYNALADDFWRKAAEHPDWASYIVLADSEGGRTYMPAVRTFVMCDPARGGNLRACYTAQIVGTPGTRYVWVGLCYAKRDDAVMSRADIDYRSDGEKTEIGATVYIRQIQSDNVTFCGGNNPLVRRLLGCGTAATYTVGWGTCDYPARVCERTDALIAARLPATLVPLSGGWAFDTQGNAYGDELVLFSDDTAVLRALRPQTFSARTLSTVVGSRCAVLADCAGRVAGIASARLDGTSLLRVDACRVYTAAVTVRSDNAVRLGIASGVKSDPGEEYLAVYTAAYAEAYRVRSGDRTLCLRVPRTDQYVEICRGGALALWGGDGITVFEPNAAGEYDSFTVAAAKGDDCVIVREGDRYHAATVESGRLTRYEVSRAGVRQIERKSVSDRCVLSRVGDAIVYGESEFRAVMIDADCTAEFACERFAVRPLGASCGAGDGFMAVAESGNTTVYDLVHDSALHLDGAYSACGRLLFGAGGAYAYDYYDGVRKLGGDCDLTGVTSACLTGGGLFAVRSGRLYAYYCTGSAMALRLPRGSEGKTVVWNVRESAPEGVGRAVRLSL